MEKYLQKLSRIKKCIKIITKLLQTYKVLKQFKLCHFWDVSTLDYQSPYLIPFGFMTPTKATTSLTKI